MPCWYYEKRELRETPSIRAGIDQATEARYRKEGARFIIDTGTKMGLRWDTCATGVVYFHRFYMFHSFREFNRFVTAATCLFLAGKVEETPKKCKDIIKATKTVLTEQQYSAFAEDPREEVMVMERILLQTLKFDLQVEHPYSYVIKFAKHLKGDRNKIQMMVQMAWTFVNDGLCTMICLLWEPDVVSVALMYLASRLNKYEVTDWEGKQPGSREKWWEALVPDVTLDILESICHAVLDLYSSAQKGNSKEESPPPPPPPRAQPAAAPHKRSRSVTPEEAAKQDLGGPLAKIGHQDGVPLSHSKPSSPALKSDKHRAQTQHNPPLPPNTSAGPPQSSAVSPSSRTALSQSAADAHGDGYPNYQEHGSNHYSQFNPYVAPNMYSSSFLSQEGSQNIQNLIGGLGSQQPPGHQPQYKYQQNAYNNPPSNSSGQYQPPPPPSNYHQPPPPGNYQQPPQPSGYSGQGSYPGGPQAGYNNQGGSREYRPPPPPGPPQPPYSSYSQGQSTSQHHPPTQGQSYMQQHPQYGAHSYNQQSSSHYPPPQGGQHFQHPPPAPSANYQNYPHGSYRPPRPHIPGHAPVHPGTVNPQSGLATVRITGRQH